MSEPASSHAAAMLREREAIVRWLREHAHESAAEARALQLRWVANAIERGEHLKPADEGQGA